MNEGVLLLLLVFYYIQVVNIVFKQNIIRLFILFALDIMKCVYVNSIVLYKLIN